MPLSRFGTRYTSVSLAALLVGESLVKMPEKESAAQMRMSTTPDTKPTRKPRDEMRLPTSSRTSSRVATCSGPSRGAIASPFRRRASDPASPAASTSAAPPPRAASTSGCASTSSGRKALYMMIDAPMQVLDTMMPRPQSHQSRGEATKKMRPVATAPLTPKTISSRYRSLPKSASGPTVTNTSACVSTLRLMK